MRIKKKSGGGGGQVGLGGGGQGGCERRIEVFVKTKNKSGRGWAGRGGVRVDVNEEMKFL